MKKSSSVFASKAERRAFAAIRAHFPDGLSLYPNLPLSQLVSVEKSELSPADWDFYLKTSVDFVLANRSDDPILGIEFDGLAGGFSFGASYRPARTRHDPNRSIKIGFKLSLCSQVAFPLYVISFDEVEALAGEESLCIVHGIVAQQLVRQAVDEKVRRWDENSRGQGKTWEEMQRDLAAAETDLQHKYNPFRAGLEPMWTQFVQLKAAWSLEPVTRPEVFEALRSKQPFESIGSRFSAYGGIKTPVLLTVWVRNFAGESFGTVLSSDVPVAAGVNPLRVAENVAWYLGVKRTLALNSP